MPNELSPEATAEGSFDTTSDDGFLDLSDLERLERRLHVNFDGRTYHAFAVALPSGADMRTPIHVPTVDSPDITPLRPGADIDAWREQVITARPDGSYVFTTLAQGLRGWVREPYVIGSATAGEETPLQYHYAVPLGHLNGDGSTGPYRTPTDRLITNLVTESVPGGTATQYTFTRNPHIVDQLGTHLDRGDQVMIVPRPKAGLDPALKRGVPCFIEGYERTANDGRFHLLSVTGERPEKPFDEAGLVRNATLHYTVVSAG